MASTAKELKARFAVMVIALAWFAVVGGIASAEETAGRAWPKPQRVSIDQIDHASYDQLLQKYVNDDGMVAYKAWHGNATDRKQLKDYLAHLSQASPKKPASREAKLAYWMNAYNAVTIEGILRVYPTSSIRNHTAKVWGYNIWKNLLLHVGEQKFSLEDIEHKVLRKMDEPRIHFAIVCASIGCPRLLNRAYVADSVEEQLATNTKDFFSRSQNLKMTGNTLALSKIVDWYGTDFAPSPEQQVQKLVKYFPESTQQVVSKGNFRVSYQSYDWDLNEQK